MRRIAEDFCLPEEVLLLGRCRFFLREHLDVKMSGHDDRQDIEGGLDRLPVLRIKKGKYGEYAEKLVTAFLVKQQQPDEKNVDDGHDETGQVVYVKGADHDHRQGFFAGQQGKHCDEQVVEESVFFSKFRGGGVWIGAGHSSAERNLLLKRNGKRRDSGASAPVLLRGHVSP